MRPSAPRLTFQFTKSLDIRMVDVEAHHLGGAAGGATRFDRAGGAVADPEEAT